MLFRRAELDGIAAGEITLAFRRWRRLNVRAGGRLTTAAGVLAIERVDVVTPEDVSNGKPDPEMFLLAADRMGVPRERCVVFEDGQLGIEAARRAQMDCVVVHAARPEAQSLETSG